MTHTRRMFDKALDNDASRAEYVLEQIQELYAIQQKAWERTISFEMRKRYRQLYAVPLLNQLESWLKDVLDRIAVHKANLLTELLPLER